MRFAIVVAAGALLACGAPEPPLAGHWRLISDRSDYEVCGGEMTLVGDNAGLTGTFELSKCTGDTGGFGSGTIAASGVNWNGETGTFSGTLTRTGMVGTLLIDDGAFSERRMLAILRPGPGSYYGTFEARVLP